MKLYFAIFVAIPLAFGQGTADAQSAFGQLSICYELATTPNEKYACMGLAVEVCQATDGGTDIVVCVSEEAEVWMQIADKTFQAGLKRAEAIEILDADNLQVAAPWTNSLTRYYEQLIALRNQKCIIESSPEESAGRPELGLSTCQMRENARMAIHLYIAIEDME